MAKVIDFPMQRRQQQISEETANAQHDNDVQHIVFLEEETFTAPKAPLTPQQQEDIKDLLRQTNDIMNKAREEMPTPRFAKHLYMSDLIPPDVPSVIYNEAIDEARENMDEELERLVPVLGEVQVRKLSELIAELVMITSDVSHAEGLSEGFMLSDETPDFEQ